MACGKLLYLSPFLFLFSPGYGERLTKMPSSSSHLFPVSFFLFLVLRGFFLPSVPSSSAIRHPSTKSGDKTKRNKKKTRNKKKDRGGGGEKGAAAGGDCDKKTPAADAQRFPYFLPENYRREKIHGISKPPPPPLHTLFMQYMSHTQARTKPSPPPLHRTTERRKPLSCSGGRAPAFLSPSFPAYFPKKKVSRPRAWKIGADAIVGSVVV